MRRKSKVERRKHVTTSPISIRKAGCLATLSDSSQVDLFAQRLLPSTRTIAEGSGKNSDRDFARFLEQAYGSAMETASLVLLAVDLGFLKAAQAQDALEELHGLSNQIAALNRSLKVKQQKTAIPEGNLSPVSARHLSTFDSRPST